MRVGARRKVAILIGAGLLAAMACGKPADPVAQVDGKWIGQEQWAAFCSARGVDARGSEAERREALTRLVRREVGAVLAQRRGLLNDKEQAEQEKKIGDLAAQKAYLNDLVRKRGLPKDADLEAAFQSENTVFDLAVVPVRTEEAAKSVRTMLEGGMPFDAAFKKFGEATSSLPPDGRLRDLSAGNLAPDARKVVADAGAGKFFGPVEAGQGWLVGKVEGARVPSHEEFLKAAANLRQEALQKIEVEEHERAGKTLASKYPLQTHEEVLKLFADGKAQDSDAEKVAGEVGEEKITLGELGGAFQAASQRAGGQIPMTLENLKQLLEVLAADARIIAEAKTLGFGKGKEAGALAWDMRQEMAARLFIASYLKDLAVPDATLQEYFQKNPQHFRVPDRLHLRALVASSVKALENAAGAVRAGMPWEQAAKLPGIFAQQQDGDWGWVTSDQLRQQLPDDLVNQLVTLPQGGWAAAKPAPDKFMALQLVDIQRGGVPEFGQVRETVRRYYLNENGQKLGFEYLDGPGRDGIDVKEFFEKTAKQG